MGGLILLLALTSCRSGRPPLSRWDACLIRDHGLTRTTVSGVPTLEIRPAPGGVVLLLHDRWGRSAVATEYSFGELVLFLPHNLHPGLEVPVQAGEAMFREGGQILVYNSLHLSGVVRVLAMNTLEGELDLEIQALQPTVDRLQTGPRTLWAKVAALWVQDPKDCY